MPEHHASAHAEHATTGDFFMPHGHCYLWEPSVLWVQVGSNVLIGLAYVSIALTLAYLVAQVRDIPFKTMYVAFGVFIITCGFTHFLDVWVIWNPDYHIDGAVRSVTAAASVGTAVFLPPLVPKAVAIARGAKAAHDRGIELASLVDDLGRMYERTREIEQLKTQFFANVSHELRTPLALIMGPLESLKRAGGLGEQQQREIDVALRNSRTLLKHVNDLLDIAKLEAGKLAPEYSELDLSRLTRLVAQHFTSMAAERAIDLRIETPPSLLAQVDGDKMERVLLNLLSNAFKFTPDGGTVRVTLSPLKGGEGQNSARIEVGDSGPGILPEHRDAVFERFRQIESNTARRAGGTGLGLAICKNFTELHGGSITIGAAPEGGALFRIELPVRAPAGSRVGPGDGEAAFDGVSNAARQALESLSAAPEAAPAVEVNSDKPRVLVVEDNPDMNQFVSDCLSSDYRCDRAYHGEQALEMLRAGAPDLVLTDLMMPVMNGEQLVHAIRSRPELEDVPVMLLTAKADDASRVRLLQEGAQDYVAKPFAREELLARVRNLVTTKRAKDLLRRELSSQADNIDQLAEQITARARELQSALSTARVAREQAERASQVKSNFLRLVSHELRTPLTVITLQLERLRGDTNAKSLQRIERAADRLSDLIDQLLQRARIESGKLSLDAESFDLAQLLCESIEDHRAFADEKELELRLDAPSQLPVHSDRNLLRLVANNLVSNALKFTEQGRVVVAAGSCDSGFWLSVSDTGPGIAAEHHEDVFEPFVHLEPIRNKHIAGVGLGLSLVRDMVTALGGTIELESSAGQGARFRVSLPMTTRAAQAV